MHVPASKCSQHRQFKQRRPENPIQIDPQATQATWPMQSDSA